MTRATSSIVAASVVLTLAACATTTASRTPTDAVARDTIGVEVGPCFGFCPVYKATISPDGTVHYTGERHTAVLGDRTRNSGAGVHRAIALELQRFRPSTGSEAVVECTAAVSDTSPYTVTWTDAEGRRTTATIQSGCPGGPGADLVRVLRALPDRLGIADWTHQTTRPGASRG